MRVQQQFVCAAVIAVTAILPPNASAQSAQGRVLRDRAVIWDADSPIVIATVMAGVALEVTAQSERWYEVIVPESLGGGGRRGLIARAQLQLVEGSPSPPVRALRGDPLPSRSAPAASQNPPQPRGPAFARGFLGVNGIVQTTSNDFADTVEFREHAENSRFETAYVVDGAPGFSVTGGSMLSPFLGVGASLGRIARSTPAAFTAAVPHPFFFGTPRRISADIPQMRREELAVHAHVRAVWPLTDRLQVSALGGPSLFRVRQDVVSTFSFAESYPYDTAAFRSSESVEATATKLGFNVGGDVTMFLSSHIGVGVSATFSRATADLDVSEGRTARVRAGGLNTGAGLRLRF